MEPLGTNIETERDLFLLELDGFEQIPSTITLPSQFFGLFLASDANQIPDAQVLKAAASLLGQGMVYVCCWGGDCERVHDLFDDVIVKRNPKETEKSVIFTTWLDKKSLSEGLWYFLFVGFPAEDYEANCQAELVVTIGNPSWAGQIRERLKNQHQLRKEVIGKPKGLNQRKKEKK